MRTTHALAGLVVASRLLTPAPAPAECTDYADYLHVVGSVPLPSQAVWLDTAGDYVYVADNDPGLQVIDISDPEDPELVATAETSGCALGVAISGTHAYVADGQSGLQVIDISDPRVPRLVGHLATVSPAQRVAVSGDRAYIGEVDSYPDWTGTIEVVDISDPMAPRSLGSVALPDAVSSVAVDGFYVYAAANSIGLKVIDVSDPAHPEVVATVDWPSYVQDVAIHGSHAYVATGGGLKVVDVADPTQPQCVAELDTPGYAYSVFVAGTQAYLAEIQDEWPPYGLIQAIDIQDPQAPAIIASLDLEEHAYRAILAGDHLYVASGEAGLQVVAAAHLLHPPIAGRIDTPEYATGVAVAGDFAYVSDSWSGLQVVGVSDPSNGRIVGTAGEMGAAMCVAVSGSLAYVGDGGWPAAVRVVDVTEPDHPRIIGSSPTSVVPVSLACAGDYVYAAECNLHDPLHSLIEVFNVADPGNPQLVGSLEFPGLEQVNCLRLSGDYAYVGAWHGFFVIDVHDPLHPAFVAHLDDVPWCCGIDVSGTYAFVADGGANRFLSIDITDPCNPQVAGSLALDVQPWVLSVAGHYAYTAGVELRVIDIADPFGLKLVGQAHARGQQTALVSRGDCLFVSDGYAGLTVMHGQCDEALAVPLPEATTAVRVAWCRPNPSRGPTTVHLVVNRGGMVSPSVHDAAGRLIRRLPECWLRPGENEIAWDGRDGQGRDVGAGVYFVLVPGPGEAATARAIVVR